LWDGKLVFGDEFQPIKTNSLYIGKIDPQTGADFGEWQNNKVSLAERHLAQGPAR
jgi:hypothetical protein